MIQLLYHHACELYFFANVHFIHENANDSIEVNIWKCTLFIAYLNKLLTINMNTDIMYMCDLCVCVCAFFTLVHVNCNKFTSLWNAKRVDDLCAICMFKRNSNQIIALLVRINYYIKRYVYAFLFLFFSENYVDNEIWYLYAWVLFSSFLLL